MKNNRSSQGRGSNIPLYLAGSKREILTPGPIRESAFEAHPLVTNTALLPTPPVQDAYQVIATAIVHRRPGVCFTGDFRAGKSKAIALIRASLPETFPRLANFSISAKDHDSPTEKALYMDMLSDLRHAAPMRGTAMECRTRLLGLLLAHTENRAALFIDEAQNYSIPDLTRLRDLTNDMDRNGISVTTILFGDHRLLQMRQVLEANGRRDLLGRFFLFQHTFRSLRDQADIKLTLGILDDPQMSEFPEGSGISYTEFFFPTWFATGWRLADEASKCWHAITNFTKAHPQVGVGMQWMATILLEFVLATWDKPDLDLTSTVREWYQSVERSGLQLAIGVTSPS